jgi:hypothetical protein
MVDEVVPKESAIIPYGNARAAFITVGVNHSPHVNANRRLHPFALARATVAANRRLLWSLAPPPGTQVHNRTVTVDRIRRMCCIMDISQGRLRPAVESRQMQGLPNSRFKGSLNNIDNTLRAIDLL